MSADQGHEILRENYTAVYSHFFNEDAVDAYELSQEKPIEEFDADLMIDALHRHGYIDHVSSDEGELYSVEEFGLDTHQEIMEEFNL